MIRSYSELICLPTFEERYRYLKLGGQIGKPTFGSQRWINQEFYHSPLWLKFRDAIIIRDNGCDLGMEGFEIYGSIIIHHLNPISYDDILNMAPCITDPENAISTKLSTHNAIHYGDESLLYLTPLERTFNDTCPWKKQKRRLQK